MNSERPENEWDAEWRKALGTLGQSPSPPAGLKRRVVDSLRGRRLVRSRPARRLWPLWAALTGSACLLCFLAGCFWARSSHPTPSATAGPQYLLLLFDGPGTPAAGSKESARLVREYSEWAKKESVEGHLTGGEELGDRSIEISGVQGKQVHEQRSALGGYFLIKAADAEEALAIARTCPHLKHGGSLELRPIEATPKE